MAFQVAINWIFWASFVYPAEDSPRWFPWMSLGIVTAVSSFAGWLLTRFCPEAAGSGVPQLKLAFWKDFGHTPRRLAWVKFLGSALSIGGEQSLGREGPSVQLGGNVASTIAGLLGVPKQQKRAAAAAGAAAGLAAAFNAPLAAVAFVLEEVLDDLNSRLLGSVLLAAIIGAFVVHALLGAQSAFDLPRIDEPTWRAYLIMPIVALLATLCGAAFQRSALCLRGWSRTWRKVPALWRPLLGGWITWALGMAVYTKTWHPGVFGLGYDDLSQALILHYEQARLLGPRDPAVAQNLRAQAGLDQMAVSAWQKPAAGVINALAILVSICLLLLCVLLFGTRFLATTIRAMSTRLALGLGVVALLSASAVAARWPELQRWVVQPGHATARPAPAANADAVFELKGGELVTPGEEHGAFIRVHRADGRAGWVGKTEIAPIIPPAAFAPSQPARES